MLVDKSRASFSLSIIRSEPETGHISRHFLLPPIDIQVCRANKCHTLFYKCRSGPSRLIDRCRRHILDIGEPSRLSEIETGLFAELDNYLLRIENSLGPSEANTAATSLTCLSLIGRRKSEMLNRRTRTEMGYKFWLCRQFDLLKSYGQVQDENDFEAIGMMTSMRNVDTSASVKVVFK